MYKQLQAPALSDVLALKTKDLKGVPVACRYGNLSINDVHRVQNENSSWLKEYIDRIPIWSRLKSHNCIDQPRELLINKIKNYDVEIPGRLISLFGHEQQHTTKMNMLKGMTNFYLVACAVALCSALSYNLLEWSPELLDNIIIETVRLYTEILRKNKIIDREFNMNHLNQMLQFQGINYQITQQQVATGYLYMPYGFNEFNLARALNWFFRCYQFGIVQCGNRSLAFGFTLDSDYGFFMYDCTARGHPLLKDEQANSYILRTNHLQVLLYCMVITFNVTSDRVEFFLYNVDVRIVNPTESNTIIKEAFVPTIDGSEIEAPGNVETNVNDRKDIKDKIKSETKLTTSESNQNVINNVPVTNKLSGKSNKLSQQCSDKKVTASKIFNAIETKNSTQSSHQIKTNKSELINKSNKTNKTNLSNEIKTAELTTKTSKTNKSTTNTTTPSNTLKNTKKPLKISLPAKSYAVCRKQVIEVPKKIPIDPNKNYYIIAVPKDSQTAITRLPAKKDTSPNASANPKALKPTVKVNIQRVMTVKPETNEKSPTLKLLQKSAMEIDLKESESTVTLTNELVNKEKFDDNTNPLGLKVYLIDNRRKRGLVK